MIKKSLHLEVFKGRFVLAVALFLCVFVLSNGLGLVRMAGAVPSAVIQLGTPAAQYNTSTTLSNFTVPAGTDRLLVVAAGHTNSTNITGVTFNGNAMTEVIEANDGFAANAFYILTLGTSASSTTGNVIMTASSGGASDEKYISAAAFANVDQTTPVDNNLCNPLPAQPTVSCKVLSSLSAASLVSTLTIPSEDGDLVIDHVDVYGFADQPTATIGGGQTALHNVLTGLVSSTGFSAFGSSIKDGGAPNVAMTWTGQTTVDDITVMHLAMNINAASYTPPALEPTNYPTNFTATANSHTQITTSWTDSTGAVLPSGYLVLCSLTDSFSAPQDGSAQSDDTDCSDGSGVQNVAHGSGGSIAWTGLDASQAHYFTIFPYTAAIEYKTDDGTPPTADATTLQTPGTITYQKAVTQGDPNTPNQGFTLNIRRPDGSIISGLSDVKPGTGPWGNGGLTPGLTYSVHEVSIPAGWQLDNIACVDTVASSTFGTFTSGDTSIEVTLAPGGVVVCTFTNSFDITPPTITAPSSVFMEAPISSDPANTGTATATDDRGTPTVTYEDTNTPGNCAGNFVITRTWKATDAAGNEATAVQTITSQDTTAPNLTVPANVQVGLGDSTDPSNTGTATATDAGSGPPTVTYSDSQVGNVITRTWTATDGCGNQISDDQTITIVGIDLEVTISESAEPMVAGTGNLVHTVTVKNNGPGNATNIVIKFGANTVTAPSVGFSVGNNLPLDPDQWVIPSLASGDSATMTLTWNVGDGYSDSNPIFSNAFVQFVDQTDTDSSNDSDSEGTTVAYDIDLTLAKIDGGVTPAPGDVLVYDLFVLNSGVTAALNTTFRETVPANTSFNAASSSTGWSCSDGATAGTVCTLDVGTVAGNGGGVPVSFAVNVLPSAYPSVIVNNASVSANNSSTASASSRTSTYLLYLSSEDTRSIDGLAYADEDIIVYDPADDSWAMHFDGSDVNIDGDIYGFALLEDGTILMAFKDPLNVPGVGSVTRQDVVRFTPASLGDNTTGTFDLIFDGSDVAFMGDIDALGVTADGRLILSVTGSWRVPASGGGSISGADEDLIIFNATSLGDTTVGDFELLYDGSDVDMSSEDTSGVWFNPDTGDLFLTTSGDFSVTGLSGKDEDIFRFDPTSLGSNTAGSYGPGLLFDGSAVGFTDRITGFAINADQPLLATIAPPSGNEADLSIVLADDNVPVTVGDMVTYSATVHNNGPDAAQNVQVVIQLDSEVLLQSVSSSVGSCSGTTTVTCSLGTLNSGSSATITVETNAIAAGTAVNNATVSSDTVDPVIGNDSDGEDTVINSGGSATGNIIYISATGSGNVGGVRYEDEDILAYYPDSDTWAMFFDGSLQGFTRDINAFHIADDGSIYMSFDGTVDIPDVGTVDDSDIVFYNATTGLFSLFFDGSDHDLTTSDEDIDGLWVSSVLPIFAVSTTGTAKVNGSSLEVRDEDVMLFNMSTGLWTMGVDNSDVGYTGDVDALYHTGNQFFLSLNGSFSAVGAERQDVFILHATALGDNTVGTFGPGLFFDASAVGFSGDVDGLHVSMNP